MGQRAACGFDAQPFAQLHGFGRATSAFQWHPTYLFLESRPQSTADARAATQKLRLA